MLFEPSASLTRTAEARLAGMAPHVRPMWLPVMANDCALALVFHGEGAFTIPARRPALALFGDDEDGRPALGPAGFHRPSVAAFLRRCGSVLVAAGAPDVVAYSWIGLRVATERHDCAVVETRPEHEDEWLALVAEAMPRERAILVSSPTRRGPVH